MSTISIARKQKKAAEVARDFVYIPEDFDPKDYPGPIKAHPDAARWFLNCIHFRRVTRHYAQEEFVNLHSGLLSLVMGKTEYVKPIRSAMQAYGLIECDDQWSLGKKSLGYRIGPALQGKRWKRYYSTNKRFLKRLDSFKSYVTEPRGLTLPQHHHLAEWVRRVKVHPDHKVVFNNLGDDKRELPLLQVESIEQGMIYTSVCEYGRFHSNITNLSRPIRPYLTIDGTPLVEVDLVNSQPYFLAIILLEIALSKSSTNVSSLSDLVFSTLLSLSPFSPNREEREQREPQGLYVFPLSIPLKNGVLDLIPEDLRQFIQVALKGGFYETFELSGQCDRDDLKRKVFQVLYGSRHCQEHAELGAQFQGQYPTAFKMLDTLKRQMGYEWVGRELQRRESQIVINSLVGDLLRDHPDVPIVTIHDSLMTTEKHLPLVQSLLRQHLTRNYYQPRLKHKPSAIQGSLEGPVRL